jgi:hypothetical protein
MLGGAPTTVSGPLFESGELLDISHALQEWGNGAAGIRAVLIECFGLVFYRICLLAK